MTQVEPSTKSPPVVINPGALRKDIDTEKLLGLLPQAADPQYWRDLNPDLPITGDPFGLRQDIPALGQGLLASYRQQLGEEGYFQTEAVLPALMLQLMRQAVERVRAAGFPATFALVYDAFYEAIFRFDKVLCFMLGADYRLIPNFWLYCIDPSDQSSGFEPHRDAEYTDTIGADGLPTVITIWITITDATPLNSCLYLLPKNRDPQYNEVIHNLKTGWSQLALPNLRALPTQAGTLSCWDQYVFHYGSRASRRAPEPRISIAAYCQRGDIPSVGDADMQLPASFGFERRLSIICRALRRYSYVSLQKVPQASPVLAFLTHHADAIW